MPGPTVHFSVANQLFQMFRVDLSLASPESRLAFLAGAMGPDLGYLSLFHTFLSDLVHYVDSGDFVSKMSLISDSDIEHAFVAGWASHCLVDNTMHPLINAAVGRTFSADKTPLTFAEQPAYHIRIETGLDASFRSTGELEAGVTDVWQQPNIMRLMHASYQETYNARFELDEFRLMAKLRLANPQITKLSLSSQPPAAARGAMASSVSLLPAKAACRFHLAAQKSNLAGHSASN